MDSSFLDPRLQSALYQSQLVQSQLRLTVFKPQDIPQNQKQRGKMRRSNTVERGIERGTTLVFGRLLLETSIKQTVKAFMGRDLEKIVDMLTIKILRMRPIVPKTSM
ncbi:hypothetical protein EON65_58035 [archaeon]|nr:MAG: hypothetical protein EON65_58035 [archaeon]